MIEQKEKNLADFHIESAVKEDLEDALSHGILVSNLAFRLAKELRESESFCHDMAEAGMMHDVGKLRLCEYLYGRSEGTLGIEEMQYMRLHPKLGYDILKSRGNYSETVMQAVYHHHENFDGSGYPDNLKEETIPFGARIIRTCDVFAALVSNRPYRKAFDKDTAIRMMIEEVKHFDMRIFLAFMKLAYEEDFDEIEQFVKDANDKNVFDSSLIPEDELALLVGHTGADFFAW